MQVIPEISVETLADWQADVSADFVLLDVREAYEREICTIKNDSWIPLGLLSEDYHELPASKPIVVYCKSGGRSFQACQQLSALGYEKIYNLQGGILAWNAAFNPESPRY